MNNLENILHQFSNKLGKIAILIDPDKNKNEINLIKLIKKINDARVDFIFIGGSTVSKIDFDFTIDIIKKNSKLPIIIFPGSKFQISDKADAILYLSLISGRNPEYLIGQHIESAKKVSELNIEVIPTGYILISGGIISSVEKTSGTKPIDRTNNKEISQTALAGKLLGKRIIFFDAGSGAKEAVPSEIIKEVSNFKIPIIVGGGINSIKEIIEKKKAGANVIVIGNKIEKDESFLEEIKYYNLTNT